YQEGMAKYNAANETNVRVMDQYSNVTSGTKAALPTEYGILESDGASISVNQPAGPPPVGPPPYIPPETPPRNIGHGDPGDGDHTTTTSVDPDHTGGPDKPGG